MSTTSWNKPVLGERMNARLPRTSLKNQERYCLSYLKEKYEKNKTLMFKNIKLLSMMNWNLQILVTLSLSWTLGQRRLNFAEIKGNIQLPLPKINTFSFCSHLHGSGTKSLTLFLRNYMGKKFQCFKFFTIQSLPKTVSRRTRLQREGNQVKGSFC